MDKILAVLASLVILAKAGIIYPQTLIVDTVQETEGGHYAVTLHSSANFQYGTVTDMDDLIPGDVMAAVMYCNETPDDVRDDTIATMRYTGFSLCQQPTGNRILLLSASDERSG